MKDIYVCNVSSNYVSKINLDTYSEEKIYISRDKINLGIHGIDLTDDYMYVASNNTYNFYNINLKNKKINSCYIGTFSNDIKFKDNHLYLICGEINSLIVYDTVNKSILYQIKCGNYPHNMDINKDNKLMVITNMYNNELTLIDYKINDFIKSIRTGNLPSTSKFHKNGKYVFVCESNLGDEKSGTFSVYNCHTGQQDKRITLSKSPIDMCFDYEMNLIFVSNYFGNCISVIDLIEFREIRRVEICGTPRGIYKFNRFLYVVLSDKEMLIKYDLYENTWSYLKIGADPTCIISY